jgi:peptidoglycan/xylan/chitin deacetylase (PgdA/CDA1 family)
MKLPRRRFAREHALARARIALAGAVAATSGTCVGCRGTSASPSHDSSLTDAAVGRAPAAPPPTLSQINGQAFPDHVIALTWDDGPDRGTVGLAEYLSRQKISATFFVVSEWSKGLSSDPGEGTGVFETGFVYLDVLEQLVGLGHRLGNHTLNHVILTEVEPAEAANQVRANQERIDAHLTNELRLFRAPGGAWNAAAASAIFGDPYLAGLVGPIRWDVDRKDWDSSRACSSDRPEEECEKSDLPGLSQVKASVVAERYLASIEDAKRGIVLLHDRVGHVGSAYATDLARALVPALKTRGFVFAPPVLAFSPLVRRAAHESVDGGPSLEPLVGIADLDGDRRADLCVRDGSGVLCAPSTELPGSATDRLPRTIFRGRSRWDLAFGGAEWAPASSARSIQLADVDGDARADLCGMKKSGIVCALATTPLAFGAARAWLPGAPPYATLLLGDVDGDGKADACGRVPGAIACARSAGAAFEPARTWLQVPPDVDGGPESAGGFRSRETTLVLADVDGDGRADICGTSARGIDCALSRRTSFAPATRWSQGVDFSDADVVPWAKNAAYGGTIRFGDLNGDGRADVCGRGPAGVVCALSTGRGFTTTTVWLRTGMADADGWLDAPPERVASVRLADINGDRRADLCTDSPAGVVCGLAP